MVTEVTPDKAQTKEGEVSPPPVQSLPNPSKSKVVSIFMLLAVVLSLAGAMVVILAGRDNAVGLAVKRIVVLWASLIAICVSIWVIVFGGPGANIPPLVARE